MTPLDVKIRAMDHLVWYSKAEWDMHDLDVEVHTAHQGNATLERSPLRLWRIAPGSNGST